MHTLNHYILHVFTLYKMLGSAATITDNAFIAVFLHEQLVHSTSSKAIQQNIWY